MTSTTNQSGRADNNDPRRGFLFAVSAYGLWGLLPLYLKALSHIPAMEILAHRIIWSVPVAAVVLYLLGRTADIAQALRSPRTMAMAALTAALISCNWGIYIWAIATDRAVEAALGYYINPLVSILLAALALGERLDRLQIAAVALAAVAVVILTVNAGGLPLISLGLAFSFAAYGFLRKTLPIGPSQGFFLEVLILFLPALAFVLWLMLNAQNHFHWSRPVDILLLLGCGPVTAIPLILFAFGAKLLRYSTIGIMQYIVPTMIFLIAVFVFKEPFGGVKALAFALIWAALALYSGSMLRGARATSRTKNNCP